MDRYIPINHFADLLGISRATLAKWEQQGRCVPDKICDGQKMFEISKLLHIPEIRAMYESKWEEEMQTRPVRNYTSIELFAGAGGLALGLEMAGFTHLMLNEIEHDACVTLRCNRPNWNVVEQDIRKISFKKYRKAGVDLISGGFPCQSFSYAGKQGGFRDTRGTLFFELARAVREIQPKIFMGENVRGIVRHDGGRTFAAIRHTIAELGYTLLGARVLKAIMYNVPQKRERLIMIAVRNDLIGRAHFKWPDPCQRVQTLRDAFFAGELYDCDVPLSDGQQYPPAKRAVMRMVPMGGDWRDLPVELQKEYMGGSFYLGGGKTGMARRLSLYDPSLTLTCAPAQKQTERCHPIETRPLTVREYARIQTFPDEWEFSGSLASRYRQIGNAVPVNLAYAVGRALIRMFNGME